MGFFGKLRGGFKKTADSIAFKLHNIFKGGVLDEDFYERLEGALLAADCGVDTCERILDSLKKQINVQRLKTEPEVRAALRRIMADIIEENPQEDMSFPLVIMIVGVNGVGKTTAIGKLARYFKQQKKSVTIAAADTFRAAASEQLSVWADRSDCRIIKHGEGADPAAVVFDAISSQKSRNTDVLLIDTAGRLHNKKNLMEELKKINRVRMREYPEAMHLTFIVLDATTGQNALSQVEVFDEAVDIDGIILTKMDGTAKGGVVLAICNSYNTPIYFVGVGEGVDDLCEFDTAEFTEAII